MVNKLERIANDLLMGKINSVQAEELVKPFKNKLVKKNSVPKVLNSFLEVGENYVKLGDEAYVEFYFEEDSFGENFLWINKVESFVQNKGNFGILLNELELIAKRNKINSLRLEVDYDNERAISIYSHFDFYVSGESEIISENVDRINMRKDLFYCE